MLDMIINGRSLRRFTLMKQRFQKMQPTVLRFKSNPN